jgi:hypothetical protein
MKLLSAKNKRYGILGFAILGGLFIFSIVYGSIKAGVKEPGLILSNVWAGIKSLFPTAIVTLAVLSLLSLLASSGSNGEVFAVALGVLTTGASVVSVFNTTYLPKMFNYTATTQLTGVKITVQGEGVIFDSDAPGLNHAGVIRLAGQVTNNYTFRIANGLIKAKNIIWEFTNSAAQTPTVYVESDETPNDNQRAFLQYIRQAILANSGQDFSDFATLSLPSLGASDQINVLYRDGTQQQLNRADVLQRLQFTQNVVNTPVYTIDNFAQNIKVVNIIAAAQQLAYVQRWIPAVSGGMISQTLNR